MKVVCVVGARPNFMKVAPVHAELLARGHQAPLVHTGQHYDAAMSEIFFTELGMPRPDFDLEVGSASHAVQTARVMQRFEPVLGREKPDAVLVAGDVNSTLACTLVAVKLGTPVVHLEAGLRSFDRGMPEEVNRVVTDQLSTLLLTPSKDGDENLRKEGIASERIVLVGNAMIDSLEKHKARALALPLPLGLQPQGFALVTLHRPSNVDDASALAAITRALNALAEDIPVVFPVHPRTRARLGDATLERVHAIAPQGYLEFLSLEAQAKLVLTDSGGVQEETTALGVPCLTLRDSTERPVTVTEGTNTLVGTDPQKALAAARKVLATGGKRGRRPAFWDGRTSVRVADALEACFAGGNP